MNTFEISTTAVILALFSAVLYYFRKNENRQEANHNLLVLAIEELKASIQELRIEIAKINTNCSVKHMGVDARLRKHDEKIDQHAEHINILDADVKVIKSHLPNVK